METEWIREKLSCKGQRLAEGMGMENISLNVETCAMALPSGEKDKSRNAGGGVIVALLANDHHGVYLVMSLFDIESVFDISRGDIRHHRITTTFSAEVPCLVRFKPS